MKKFAFLLACAAFFSCAKSGEKALSDGEKKLSVVATIFPIYDWTREILGENPSKIELSLLVRDQIDMHSFQPSVLDLMLFTSSDLAILVGGESESHLVSALENSDRRGISLNLLDALGGMAKIESLAAGAEHSEEAHEEELDEHIWLSLRNARVLTKKIAESLGKIDPKNALLYEKNAESYAQKLQKLDDEFSAAIANAASRALIVCDRFPFRYLADDYSLECYAAFSGCSAETEASFETIAFLSEKLREKNLNCVAVCETSDKKIARTVIENSKTDAQIVSVDSLQSTTLRQAQEGKTYLSAMAANIEAFCKALETKN